jgi:hypothetical protein
MGVRFALQKLQQQLDALVAEGLREALSLAQDADAQHPFAGSLAQSECARGAENLGSSPALELVDKLPVPVLIAAGVY